MRDSDEAIWSMGGLAPQPSSICQMAAVIWPLFHVDVDLDVPLGSTRLEWVIFRMFLGQA